MKKMFKGVAILLAIVVLITVPSNLQKVSATEKDGNVEYNTHIQNVGWQGYKSNGETSGTNGQALRLEGIKIRVLDNENLGIQYTTHVQDYGWLRWSSNDEMSGTSGQSKRLEAIKIKLTGTDKDKYDVYYRVHAQDYGWLDWAKNGQAAGTAGYGKRLEAIEIKVIAKNSAAPGATTKPYEADGGTDQVAGDDTVNVGYQTHIQNVGWQELKYNGEMSGTSGQSLRLECIKINVTNKPYSGGISYSTHVQNTGWLEEVYDGGMSGTFGLSSRLEAIKMNLYGDMARHYDIYYRVHAQDYGWLGWAKNGKKAGTEGLSKRLEGIEIVIVEKGGAAPGTTDNAFITKDLVPPSTVIEPDIIAEFEEEFTIYKGEIAQIEGKDVFIRMVKSEFIEFDGYTNTQVFYSLSASGKTYTGGCSLFSTNETISWTDQYNPYNIIVEAGTMDSMTIKVQDMVIPDEPLVLSGKAEDKLVTTKLEYIETDRFIVYLDSGVTVEGDLIQNIKSLMANIESETGLSYNSYLTGVKFLDDSKHFYYDNSRKFDGVDPEANKISIYVVNDDISPNGTRGSIVLTSSDITFHDGDMMAMIHELVHCVHSSNGEFLCKPFDEGYATYMTTLINDKYEYDNYSYKLNYSNYEKEITADNAEQLFLTESGWNAYLYGYRFITYLMETYNKETLNEIINAFPVELLTSEPSIDEVAEAIKEKTSDTVFEDFGTWYVDNEAKFEE